MEGFWRVGALTGLSVVAQAQVPEVAEKELLALLNTRVTVASKKAVSARETPGIVSVLTRDEILASGARDLIDVLRQVPGFEFGVDVQGAVGISVRGLWAHEGKVLLLWDGFEMNETLFGNVLLGQRFPVDQIARIEIIRGPGSSLYGGYAEVAVIHITTLKATVPGASIMQGQGQGGALRTEASLVAGGTVGSAIWDLGAFGGEGQRSRGTYIDPTGLSVGMGGQSKLRPGMLNLGIQVGGVAFRLLADQYLLDTQDNLGPVLAQPAPVRFTSLHGDLRGSFAPGPGWTLQPFLTWKTQKPWWSTEPATNLLQLTTADRTKAGLVANLNPSGAWSYALGAESTLDKAEIKPGSNTPPAFLNGRSTVEYHTTATFAQAQFTGPINITLGARYESSDATRSSFVPRLALTKAWETWHIKLLWAKAFRSPAILNLNLPLDVAQPLNPEETTSSELELGHRIGPGLLTLSVFDVRIDKPIVFTVTNSALGYFNQSRTGSRGFELDYHARLAGTGLTASWSHHEARNDVEAWSVPSHAQAFLGAPQDKLVCTLNWRRGDWSLNPAATWLGSRWAYAYSAAAGGLDLKQMDADLLLQVNVAWEQGPWHASLALYDLLDRAPAFIQPYKGGHPPLPGPGREAVLRLRYGF